MGQQATHTLHCQFFTIIRLFISSRQLRNIQMLIFVSNIVKIPINAFSREKEKEEDNEDSQAYFLGVFVSLAPLFPINDRIQYLKERARKCSKFYFEKYSCLLQEGPKNFSKIPSLLVIQPMRQVSTCAADKHLKRWHEIFHGHRGLKQFRIVIWMNGAVSAQPQRYENE